MLSPVQKVQAHGIRGEEKANGKRKNMKSWYVVHHQGGPTLTRSHEEKIAQVKFPLKMLQEKSMP